MIEMGLMVGIGLLVTMFKLNWNWRMKMLSNPVLMDVAIFTVLTLLHWGTFSGVMVATIGALVCSLVLSAGRFLFGYIDKSGYTPGTFNVSSKL